jgi:hypothetical protein
MLLWTRCAMFLRWTRCAMLRLIGVAIFIFALGRTGLEEDARLGDGPRARNMAVAAQLPEREVRAACDIPAMRLAFRRILDNSQRMPDHVQRIEGDVLDRAPEGRIQNILSENCRRARGRRA